MTDPGHTVTGADEVAAYVAAVRDALADLPPRERDELLEDLSAHLMEVVSEGDLPLWNRLGPPWEYAAELRATVRPADGPAKSQRVRQLTLWGRQLREQLGKLDLKLGPLLGYERVSEFARLLVPAWWVLRGYLVAMFVVMVLEDTARPGLLPRLSESTLVGVAILLAFVIGSVWLARREQRFPRWPRRGIYVGSVLLVLFGISQFAMIDAHERRWYGPSYVYSEYDPFADVIDVVPVDPDGRVLTDVRLLDQDGRPIDIGWDNCELDYDSYEFDSSGRRFIQYPRCQENLLWWDLLPPSGEAATPSPEAGSPTPEAGSPTPTLPEVGSSGPPSPTD